MSAISSQKLPSTNNCANNSKARYVRIYMVDGEPDGIRNAQIDISMMFAMAFKGDQLNFGVKQEFPEEIGRAGVYLIVGLDPENPDKKLVYIGETENVGRRLNRHKGIIKSNSNSAVEKAVLTFWEDTLVFVSKDNTLTKSHIRHVEAHLIAAVDGKNGWCNVNVKKPPVAGKLTKEEASVMDKFIEEIKILTAALGFDIFRANKTPPTSQLTAATQTKYPEFIFSGSDFNATAVFLAGSTGDWLVRANSVAKLNHSATTPNGAIKLRIQLEANGTLKKTNDGLIFVTDYAFPSASSAACVVAGNSVAGPTAWKHDGKTYKDWEAELSAEPSPIPKDLLTGL